MTTDPVPTRSALRRHLQDARRALTPAVREANRRALVDRLGDWLQPAPGEVWALYWPIREEPRLDPLPEHWRVAGIRLALPVVDRPDAPLRFLPWDADTVLAEGYAGIPCPVEGEALRPALILLPCVGFTVDGYRLGYGGGFYDRTLAAFEAAGTDRPRTVGVAWDEARVSHFDPLPTDRPLDAVVTPTRVYRRA